MEEYLIKGDVCYKLWNQEWNKSAAFSETPKS